MRRCFIVNCPILRRKEKTFVLDRYWTIPAPELPMCEETRPETAVVTAEAVHEKRTKTR